ncbi:MAG TPA: Ppx/GppA phosphatase family protein [Candidatus Kapabacteria bacterium]|nr:Ppx/GppA phosphatase family protein [Candidatus Kapabacteria bacterium]
MRIAVLDIGTNTVLLLIAEEEGKNLRVLKDDHTIARLGEGVDKTGQISEEAYQRFLEVLRQHLKSTQSMNVHRVIAVGTSALRDATNREAILRRTKADTGIEIEILSGEDEARWSYVGALFGMNDVENATVLDIGGGSTEISFGDGREFTHGVSLNIGAVRLTERCFRTSPITSEAIEEARKIIRAALDHPPAPSYSASLHRRGSMLVAVAGTPTTLAAMHQGLERFDAMKVQDYILQREALDPMLDMLLKTDTATLLEHFPAVNKARADILPAGTLILREAMEFLGAESICVSTRGLRYGIALREV